MKHLLLMTAVLCLSFYGFSQDEDARTWIVGGAFNYSHDVNTITYFFQNNEIIDRERTSDGFYIRPSFAKIINPKWTFGIAPSFGYSTYRSDAIVINNILSESTKQTSNSISVSAFARYTINPENRFNIFLRPNLEFTNKKTTHEYDGAVSGESKSPLWSVGIGTGILYQLSEKFNLTGYLGGISYSAGTTKDQLGDNPDRKDSRFGLDFGSSFSTVGLEYKF